MNAHGIAAIGAHQIQVTAALVANTSAAVPRNAR